MGIRFLCPNGHKLNVKAFLAGERGICPQCDAKFLVPSQSGGQVEAISEAALAAASGPQTEMPTGETPASETSFAALPPVAPPSPPEPTPPAPVAAAPEIPPEVWYVRTASGEQFGPARSEVMRDWVAEGRVTVDCWVWRTGWPDWKSGGQAITLLNVVPPDIAPTNAAAVRTSTTESPSGQLPGSSPTFGDPTLGDPAHGNPTPGALPEATSPTVAYQATKRLRQERARKVTLLLGVIVLMLFAVLVAVLINNK